MLSRKTPVVLNGSNCLPEQRYDLDSIVNQIVSPATPSVNSISGTCNEILHDVTIMAGPDDALDLNRYEPTQTII